MQNPTFYNFYESIEKTHKKENEIRTLSEKLSALQFELQELKKLNAANTTIQWKESIKSCLGINDTVDNFAYFLKTPAFLSECISWNSGIEVTRDVKNKVASTLSFMFNKGEIGRIQQNGKTYYGLPKYFNKDLTTIKKEYSSYLSGLAA